MKPLIALILLSASAAYSADPRCPSLLTAYETAEKNAALEWMGGVADNSAPRAAIRAANITNTLLERQLNLSVMIALSCPLPSEPANATGDFYFIPALKCRSAQVKGDDRSPDCVKANWPRAQIPPK